MGFVCSKCGQVHEGLGARTYKRPDPWLGLTDEQRALGKCSDDLCQTGDGDYFIRCVLLVPLIDGPEPVFEFGVWGSLSEENFWRYVETFDDADQSNLGPMFSYLVNEVRGYPGSFSLKASISAQDNGRRPLMTLEATDHPLALAQRDGMTFDKALEIIH